MPWNLVIMTEVAGQAAARALLAEAQGMQQHR